MTVERALRLMAGLVTLISVALAYYVSMKWLWLTTFVGLNLLQSAFTNWCPAMSIFRALGMREGDGGCGGGRSDEGSCCGGGQEGGCCGGGPEQK
jgi:hypothetical protein